MNDHTVGRAFHAARARRRRRQVDVASRAGMSRWTIGRIEQGRLEDVSLGALRAVARELELSIDIAVRWRGAELDRLLGSGHDALREVVLDLLASTGGWVALPETTFSVWGERGAVDVLAWHAASDTLLVIEIKTEIVDGGRLVAQVDRYRRLGPTIAEGRGWRPARVAVLVVVADTRTNRRRLALLRGALRAAFPVDGRSLRGWLRRPTRPLSALAFMTDERVAHLTRGSDRHRRVRTNGPAAAQPAGRSPGQGCALGRTQRSTAGQVAGRPGPTSLSRDRT